MPVHDDDKSRKIVAGDHCACMPVGEVFYSSDETDSPYLLVFDIGAYNLRGRITSTHRSCTTPSSESSLHMFSSSSRTILRYCP
jgi:hypothetical protein